MVGVFCSDMLGVTADGVGAEMVRLGAGYPAAAADAATAAAARLDVVCRSTDMKPRVNVRLCG